MSGMHESAPFPGDGRKAVSAHWTMTIQPAIDKSAWGDRGRCHGVAHRACGL